MVRELIVNMNSVFKWFLYLCKLGILYMVIIGMMKRIMVMIGFDS